jgi:hypothetical protein
MAQWIINRIVDMRNMGPQCIGQARAVKGEAKAHTWRVTLLEGTAAADLADFEAQCSFIRPDGSTVAIDGTITGNIVEATFPAECYTHIGAALAILRLINETAGINIVVDKLICTITDGETDVIVEP